MATFRYWQRNKSSLMAASVFFFYPASIGLVGLLMAASHRFHILIMGDGSHAASTQARIEQMHIGLEKFLHWPFGYGIGQAAVTISNAGDFVTIDSYFLSVLVEYGILGFIAYYGIFAIAIYEGTRRYLLDTTANEDQSFLLPITASFVAFMVAKFVFSQQDNHPVVYMMLGALIGLIAARRTLIQSNRVPDLGNTARELHSPTTSHASHSWTGA
jgi:O-antigen ligase